MHTPPACAYVGALSASRMQLCLGSGLSNSTPVDFVMTVFDSLCYLYMPYT